MAETTSGIEDAGPRVVVPMRGSLRALLWIVFWTWPIAVGIDGLSSNSAAAAVVIALAGISGLAVLRGVHQQIVYRTEGVAFRDMYVIRVVKSEQIRSGWLECGGSVLVLLFNDGSFARFDAGDWRYGSDLRERREALLATIAGAFGSSYVGALGLEPGALGTRARPALRRDMHVRLAPLLPSEWGVVLVTVALVVYQVTLGSA